jgi:hypothetical protein
VVALASDAEGRIVVALRQRGGEGALCGYLKEGPAYSLRGREARPLHEGAWLTPQVVSATWGHVGFWDGQTLELRFGSMLQVLPPSQPLAQARLALFAPSAGAKRPALLVFGRGRLHYHGQLYLDCSLGWTPDVPVGNPLTVPPLAWHVRSTSELELAGLGADGTAYWSVVKLARDEVCISVPCVSSDNGYRAVAIVRPGLVAAVSPSRVDWLRAGGRSFAWSTTQFALPRPVACFPCRPTGELIVVCGNGSLVRVSVPA